MWAVNEGIYGHYVFHQPSGETLKLPPQTRFAAEALARALNAGDKGNEQNTFDIEAYRRSGS